MTAADRWLVEQMLSRLRGGTLSVVADGEVRHHGDGDGPVVEVRVEHRDAWSRIARRGGVGLGEAYIAGDWTTDTLADVLELLGANTDRLDRWRSSIHRLHSPVTDRLRSVRGSDAERDRANIGAHYDLSNDFFALFLDRSMTYSSAVFENPDQSLDEAQVNKIDRLCAKLEISEGDEVLEIGSGWGSFAVHAATHYGARVTTTTISREQADHVRKLIAERGLHDRVTLLEQHYRDLDGTFDRIASIEMIEAVDWREHDAYVEALDRLLAPGGLIGLQAILIDDSHYERAKTTTDFIKAHVFPGGCLPSLRSLAATVSRHSALQIVDVEDLGAHYVATLDEWARRLADGAADLAPLGLDDRFRRLWEFYLAYCEAGFRTGKVTVAQLVLGERDRRRPLATRAA